MFKGCEDTRGVYWCKLSPDHTGRHVDANDPRVTWETGEDPVLRLDARGDYYRAHPSGVECIEVARHMTFNVGSVLKYLWRAGLKVPAGETADAAALSDLIKARDYLDDEISRLDAAVAKETPAGAKDGSRG